MELATGGTITYDSAGNEIHTFTSSGTFAPLIALTGVEALIVAGGGSGANCQPAFGAGGGGGGGGVLHETGLSIAANPYTVTVGTANAYGVNGGNSVFDSFTAIGGGVGGQGEFANGFSGGSGGGGGANHSGTATGGAGTTGQGNAGGNGNSSGGGGGGAGSVGGNDTSSSPYGGAGGVGIQSSISGTPTYYGGGGDGGNGHDGISGSQCTEYGGGGGGGGSSTAGASYGIPGIVIIKIPVPATPSAPTVTSPTTSALSVNPGALEADTTGAEIQITLAADTTFASPIQTINPATPSAANVLSGLTAGTSYLVRLGAVGTETIWGPSTSAMTLCVAPTAVSAVSLLGASPVISWTNATGAATSNIYRSPHGAGTYTDVGTGVSGTTFTDTGAVADTAYDYAVTNVNASGESAYSSLAVLPLPPAAPSAPVIGSVTSATSNFTWPSSTAGETSMTGRYSTDGGMSWTSPTAWASVTPGGAGLLSSLPPSQAVLIEAGSVNNGGTTWGASLAMTTLALAPSNVSAAIVEPDIVLSWTNPSGSTSTNVYWRIHGTGSWTEVPTVAGSSYPFDGTLGAAYDFYVTSNNTGGESAPSLVVSSADEAGSPVYVFSTGVLMLYANDITPSGYELPHGDPDRGFHIGTIQNADVNLPNEIKDAHGCPWADGVYALAGAAYGGKATIKAGTLTMYADALNIVAAAVKTGTTNITANVDGSITLPPFKLLFIVQDTNGNQHQWTFYNVRANGLSISAKDGDFTAYDVDMFAEQDDEGRLFILESGTGQQFYVPGS